MKTLKINQRPTDRSEKSVMSYFDAVTKQPVITPEEEKELLSRIQQGDKEAKDRLVCGNLRFVISVAKQYQGQGLSLADLIEEGNLGLIKAAERFHAEKENKFISYAVWWIRNFIQEALQNNGRTIRLPKRVFQTRKDIIDFCSRHELECGNPSTYEEIAEGLGIEYDKVSEIMATEKKEASLDSTLFDEDRTISDTLAQNYFEAPDFGCSESDTATLLQQALDNILKERDANIIRQFFGLEGECKSTQALSAELNLSRERIRQIISKSLEKLRESQFSRQLRMCC